MKWNCQAGVPMAAHALPWSSVRGALALLFWLVASSACHAQIPTVPYDGVEVFGHILNHFKVKPITRLEDLPNYPPDETLIILFKDLSPLDTIHKLVDDIDEYALLLASDREAGLYPEPIDKRVPEPNWPLFRKLRITGMKVWQDENAAFRAKQGCPMLRKEDALADHPLFARAFTGIAANRPSYIQHAHRDLERLAWFTEDCHDDGRGQFDPDRMPTIGYMFATAKNVKPRTLIMAGHGLFMNGMLVSADCDNGLFAVNAVRWLLPGPSGTPRKYVLFIHNGTVVERLGLPLTAPPEFPAQLINKVLRDLENENIFKKIIEDSIGWNVLVQWALVALTCLVFFYGVYRLFLTRHSQEWAPLLVGMAAPAKPIRRTQHERHLELLQQDNLWERATALARQWFLDHAGEAPPLWDQAARADPPAPILRGGWLARRKTQQQLRHVWACAVLDPARPVRLPEFQRLGELLESLNGAVRAGRLAFPLGKTPTAS